MRKESYFFINKHRLIGPSRKITKAQKAELVSSHIHMSAARIQGKEYDVDSEQEPEESPSVSDDTSSENAVLEEIGSDSSSSSSEDNLPLIALVSKVGGGGWGQICILNLTLTVKVICPSVCYERDETFTLKLETFTVKVRFTHLKMYTKLLTTVIKEEMMR